MRPKLIAFLQATGLVFYCGLVGLIMWQGNSWFGPATNFLGPVLLLVLFVISALACALIGLGYPLILFWDEKKTKDALKLVTYTVAWLALYLFLIISVLLIF
jgi:hypothetical protein